MYAFESRSRGGWFHVLVGGCFVTALLLFGLSQAEGISYPMIYQFSALILLTAGTYFMVRYVLKIYRYEISESGIISADGVARYDLVITEITGKRRRVVARVGLFDTEAVVIVPRKKKKDIEHTAKGKFSKMFHYTNNLMDPVSCYLFLPEEDSVVIIPEDEKMTHLLKQFCPVRHVT